MNRQDGGQGIMGPIRVWKRLWELAIPAMIKKISWRALHGLIPCHGILANKHIGNLGAARYARQGVRTSNT